MLVSLTIQNVVLIEKLTIEFHEGLCALTGETGAGKSILLDSLGLAMGARSDAGLVRKDAEQAQVSALFEILQSHPVNIILHNANLEGGETLILRRVITKDGRSRAFINDQPVSAGLLRQVGESLIEIHGQFDTRGLLDASTHRAMLDDYAGGACDVSAAYAQWQSKDQALAGLKAQTEKSKAEEEYLRQAVEDLDALDPKHGEEEELAALREKLMNKERVLEGLNAAYAALNGEDDPVRAAWGALDRITDKLGDAAEPITGALERATNEIAEALSAIESASADLTESEHNLETIDDRLFTLRSQARKHACAVDELAAKREELAAALNAIEHADDLLTDAARARDEARKAYITAAEKLRAVREKAAHKLDGLVATELEPLKLGKARFQTDVQPLEEGDWGPHGMDRVRFLVATNPGSEPGPLGKIASGGEMSRFMLALKVVMAEIGSAGSLIFDEVDAGIGGATADAVGERLARLATARQVLVVTHSPQVAARARYHYIVSKQGDAAVTTSVTPLASRTERAEEIARMLSGAEITTEARAAADKLLETGT